MIDYDLRCGFMLWSELKKSLDSFKKMGRFSKVCMMCWVCVCVCVFLRFSILSHVSTRRQVEFELCAGLGHRLTRSQNWP